MSTHQRLIVFTRYPAPGRVKSRLIPALGAEGAAALHRRLVLRTLRTARAACQALGAELEIWFDGGTTEAMQHWLGDWRFRSQGSGDLGERMARAFQQSIDEGVSSTVIIGTDCPGLTVEQLLAAFESLASCPAVFGPANDGGYYLIGLNRMFPGLFRGIDWGTDRVLAQSITDLRSADVKPALLESLDDLDRPEDLQHWDRICNAELVRLDDVSVIIPTLNEASQICRVIHCSRQGRELFVVDGGSTDQTLPLAASCGATVLTSHGGRAAQMNAGAALASGSVLLFLHADTLLPANWLQAVKQTLQIRGTVAGAFRFSVDGAFAGKRLVETTTNLRSKWLQKPYGDQALFLRRSIFEELGGFADMPIMEDYEFVRRLRGHGRISIAPEPVVTSARRWERFGVIRTTLVNQLMLAGYHLGVPPEKLASFYRGRQKQISPNALVVPE